MSPSKASAARVTTVDDSALLVGLCNREVKALEEAKRLYEPELIAFCERRLRDHAVAQDVVQEVFVACWKAVHSGIDGLRPWLYRIARNRCVDHARRKRRKREVSLESKTGNGETHRTIEDLPDLNVQTDPSTLLVVEEIGAVLIRAASNLSSDEQEYLRLAFAECRSRPEIAQIMAITEGQLSSLRRRVLSRLKASDVLSAYASDASADGFRTAIWH